MLIVPTSSAELDPYQITLRSICRHVVAIVGKYETLDENGNSAGLIQPYSYTGCVVEINGQWCIATAGHVLTSIQKAADCPRIKVHSQYLADQFALTAQYPLLIPFNPLDQPKMQIDDVDTLGLDIAFVHLRDLYVSLLRANGIVPLTSRQWEFPASLEFENYGVVGFPDEYTKPIKSTLVPGMASIHPAFVALKKSPDDTSKRIRRFRGEIVDMGDQESIKGMSGGPIIGFLKENGEYKYLLHAIQSTWNEVDAVHGCYVRDVMAIVDALANRH